MAVFLKKHVSHIPLGKSGLIAIIDYEDYEIVSRYSWYLSKTGYPVTKGPRPQRQYIFMHRLINKTPNGFFTDHINGDKTDNRKQNLRTVTIAENNRNAAKRIKASSVYKGVSFCRKHRSKPWAVEIQVSNKRYFVGNFKTETDAAIAYNNAARILHGEYARLNEVTR